MSICWNEIRGKRSRWSRWAFEDIEVEKGQRRKREVGQVAFLAGSWSGQKLRALLHRYDSLSC